MNDLFEKKIKDRADDINTEEPRNGHRERFAEKLALQRKPNHLSIRKMMVYIATAAAILTGVIFFIQNSEAGTENDDSLAEVQNYYAMQFESKVSEIKVLLEHVDNDDKTTVLNDIEMMKTETILTLQTTDEENIPFVVDLYSSKIEALEHIQDIFQ